MNSTYTDRLGKPQKGWRQRLYIIIFEAETRAGRLFDHWLIVFILASVAVVIADSTRSLNARFGDITPKTDLGRFIASIMMLVGWGTLAVPTGIVTSELTARRIMRAPTTRTCRECLTEGHLPEADFCMHCGVRLQQPAKEIGSSGP